MPTPPDFPHLHLALRGSYEPKFPPAPHPNLEVDANRKNPKGHASRIRGILGRMRQFDDQLRKLRMQHGLPAIPADKGFLLRLPEGVDVDQLVRALGVELVAETEEGLMLVSSVDLHFTKLEEVLKEFELGERGGGSGASLLDIYEQPDDERRLKNILAPEILGQWPLADTTTYTFDLGIQTATSTRDVKWPRVIQRGGESDADFQQRRESKRREAWVWECSLQKRSQACIQRICGALG